LNLAAAHAGKFLKEQQSAAPDGMRAVRRVVRPAESVFAAHDVF